jgi:LPXTG-motif cell wall-anchored protein
LRALHRLIVAAVGGAAAFAVMPTAVAQAHTATFTRDCTQVTVNLTKFSKSSQEDPNVVDIYRDGVKVQTITFTSADKKVTIIQLPDADHVYKASWTATGADNHTGAVEKPLPKPKHCVTPPPPPTTTAPPSATPSATPSQTVTPSVSVKPTQPSAKPVSRTLPITGQSGVLTMLIAGAVLLLAGVGAVFFAKKRSAQGSKA